MKRSSTQLNLFQSDPQIRHKLPTNSLSNQHRVQRWANFIAGYSIEFVENCLQKLDCDRGLIVDPFLGCGSTLVAAKNLGFRGVGYDRHPVFLNLARAKVENYTLEDVLIIKEKILSANATLNWSFDAEKFLKKLFEGDDLVRIARAAYSVNESINQKIKPLAIAYFLKICEAACGSQTIENAVCTGIYSKLRPFLKELFDEAFNLTKGFSEFNSNAIKERPHLLPVFQNSLGLSKAQLRRQVGSVSDISISKPASEKLSELLRTKCQSTNIQESNILQRMEITLEGIVRDLVGRVLFEEVVAHALDQYGVQYLRETEHTSFSGVVYDFCSDFVLPNADNPIAFVEVRKSSSRHASLYAKDKMFSAINWKGRHRNLIGAIVVEGEWTQATLKTMASVFDYVVPLSKATELAKILKRVQDGDRSMLKWLVEFSITQSPDFSGQS